MPRPLPSIPPLRSVAVVVDDRLSPFEFATACEVFGVDRTAQGMPAFEFAVCSPSDGPVSTPMGFTVSAPYRLEPLATADLVIVPALGSDYQPGAPLVTALHAAVERGATVVSLCSGAYGLARAGLLDGRQATTHWFYPEEFAAAFPAVQLVPDVLFGADGPIATRAAPPRRARGPPPASTSACTWSGAAMGRRWRTPWHGGWSCRPSATAAR